MKTTNELQDMVVDLYVEFKRGNVNKGMKVLDDIIASSIQDTLVMARGRIIKRFKNKFGKGMSCSSECPEVAIKVLDRMIKEWE
jgi:predicted DNA-binding protein (UPF0278 family)